MAFTGSQISLKNLIIAEMQIALASTVPPDAVSTIPVILDNFDPVATAISNAVVNWILTFGVNSIQASVVGTGTGLPVIPVLVAFPAGTGSTLTADVSSVQATVVSSSIL